MVVLTPAVTHNLADAFVNTSASELDHDYLVSIADAVLDYSLGNDNAALPVGTDDTTAMTADALQHLRDVRVVFIAAEIAAAVVFLLFIAAVVAQVKLHGKRSLTKPLIIGGVIPLALVVVLGIVGVASFDVLFTAMHKIFFADGTWTFSYYSLLICALPQAFWIGCALVWGVVLVVFCFISIVVGVVFQRLGVKVI
jgi:integral membrane protein (TIGR01906 family)